MPGMNIAQMFAQNQGNEFSGNYNNYQPSLRPMQANPLSSGVQQGNPKGSATLGGIDAAMAKRGSQDNNAQRLSSAGESSGVKFKHDDAGHATGSSAFDTLDGYMKKAGLNSFQTQFFSRMIESGMPEVMIGAAVKTAGDRFGAEVHAELQDGYEKLASIGSAIVGGLGRLGLGGLKQTAKNAVKGTIKKTTTPAMRRAGQNMAQGVRDTTKKVIGNKSRAAINPSKGEFGYGINVPAVKATGLRRGIQNVGNYVGAPSLSQVGNKGFRQAGKDYLTGVMNKNTLGQRALTGGIFGATDNDPDSTFLGNVARGVGYGLIGGKGGNRMMRRGVAGSGLGFATDLTGLTENADQKMRYAGMLMPNKLSAVPGFKGLAARAGTGEARMLPALAKKLGLQQAGNAKTNQEFVKAMGNTPFSTGMNQSFKDNLGLLDAFDPINVGLRAAGGVTRGVGKLKNKAMQTAPMQAASQTAKNVVKSPYAAPAASVGATAAAGGYGAYKMNEMSNMAQTGMDDMRSIALDAHAQMEDTLANADNQLKEALKPESIAQAGKILIQDADVKSQVGEIAQGAFGNWMQQSGQGILGAVENFMGEGAAGYLEKYWPMLLAGAAGLGGGALVGGKEGALLGGLGAPLAVLLAQESGIFNQGANEADAGGGAGPAPAGPVTVPGSADIAGPEGMRNELEASSAQPYQEGTGPMLNYQNPEAPPQPPPTAPQGYQEGQGPRMDFQNQPRYDQSLLVG